MKHARKTFKAILTVLLVGEGISASSWAFAQGGGISGSVKDISNNHGIQGVIITVKDVNIGALAGTGTTDASGNYSVGIPALGNYTPHGVKTWIYKYFGTGCDGAFRYDHEPDRKYLYGQESVVGGKARGDDTDPVLGDGGRQELPHPSPRNPGLPPSPQLV